jgi:hypothetical protein
MTLIHVPRPDPKSSRDPNRPVNALLKTQIEHLYHAEKRLPSRYRSEIYVNAIKTEGEAADYIRAVTEAIHAAHADAAAQRATVARKRKRGITIAAEAERSRQKTTSKGDKSRKRRPKE